MTLSPVTARDIEECLVAQRNEKQRKVLAGFFKTKEGEYGEGDEFLGLKAPQTRLVVKEARGQVTLDEIEKLLYSRWHEVRLAGFLLLVEEMKMALPRKKGNEDKQTKRRKELADFYLTHVRQANNWDLVDMTCPKILGYYLLYNGKHDYSILYELADSDNLWEQRVGMITNWMLIREGIFTPALEIADKLINHPHDLIHKAIGWMLREIGKRDRDILLHYLEENYNMMARTTLRYAIEKLPETERQYWLHRG